MDEIILHECYEPRLVTERDELRRASAETADSRRPVALDQTSVGRLSRTDALQNQAMAAAQAGRRHARLRGVETALVRLEAGEFGWCEGCGEPIGERRLDLDPVLVRCVACAR